MSIEDTVDYNFSDKGLLEQALTHSSICNQPNKNRLMSNQRLEFLGDAIIQLILTEYLYCHYPDFAEGSLTKMRSHLVSKKILSTIGSNLNLSEYLIITDGAKKMRDHLQESTLCDTFEALVGAIYLDSSYNQVKEVVRPLILPFIEQSLQWSKGNPKNLVQEYVQKHYQNLPEYKLSKVTGEAHNPFYTIELYVNKQYKSTGKGKSRKEAELVAAQSFLDFLKEGM